MSDDTATPSATLLRTTALSGLAAVVLVFAGQGLIQIGGGEPRFDAPAADITNFFATRDQDLFPVGIYLSVLSVIALLWFFAGVYSLMRDDWRAVVALVSGVVSVAAINVSGWELASFRVAEELDPQLARLAFDMGNMAFATAWVALGSFAIAYGWAALSSEKLPRWLGWLAIAAGVCLVAARAVWTTYFWLVGYTLFWIWVVTLCVLLLRWASTARAGAPRSMGAETR
jgi:multisubunit Na+/H+ antiporter MnhB subunit